jgi:hypothetical protein
MKCHTSILGGKAVGAVDKAAEGDEAEGKEAEEAEEAEEVHFRSFRSFRFFSTAALSGRKADNPAPTEGNGK